MLMTPRSGEIVWVKVKGSEPVPEVEILDELDLDVLTQRYCSGKCRGYVCIKGMCGSGVNFCCLLLFVVVVVVVV